MGHILGLQNVLSLPRRLHLPPGVLAFAEDSGQRWTPKRERGERGALGLELGGLASLLCALCGLLVLSGLITQSGIVRGSLWKSLKPRSRAPLPENLFPNLALPFPPNPGHQPQSHSPLPPRSAIFPLLVVKDSIPRRLQPQICSL